MYSHTKQKSIASLSKCLVNTVFCLYFLLFLTKRKKREQSNERSLQILWENVRKQSLDVAVVADADFVPFKTHTSL